MAQGRYKPGEVFTRQVKWHSKMTRLNHLGEALMAEPHKFGPALDRIFSSQSYFSSNPLSAIMWKNNQVLKISSNTFEWDMRAAHVRPLIVLEDMESGNDNPGKGRMEFKVKLDEDWYASGDVISPGKPEYQCRIMADPQRQGNGFVYTLRLVSDNMNDFVDKKYLVPGYQWTKLFSTYGEGDIEDGSTQYSMPISMRGYISKFRKKYEVTDYAAEQVLAAGVVDSDGKVQNKWIRFAEVEYWKQWYRELEIAKWYSKPARSVKNARNITIDSFPGVQDQLKDSFIHYYSEFTTELVQEYLMDVYYNRIKPGEGRKIKAFTGEYGALIFHKAILKAIQEGKSPFIVANSNFAPIQQATSELNTNAYSFGYQFVQYKMFNGVELELVINPLYDDRSLNTEIDPITGYPTESMRFTFLDFTAKGPESNINEVEKIDGYKLGYYPGLISPYGPSKGGVISHPGEFYSMHVSKEIGIKITDITRCGELILRRN